MPFKPLYAFAVVFVHVLAVVLTSTSARSTGLFNELRDEHGSPYYSWMISQDEQDRLSALLKADFYDTGVVSTYVTAPPQTCPHCGKETEFIDWVYTALERGVHSPEFIFESLKAGRTPKGLHHDVYCSGCGHLTHARDPSGNEGGALHIAHATPYDRSTRTFAKGEIVIPDTSDQAVLWIPSNPWFRKREEMGSDESAAPEKAAFWGPLGSWVSKREEEASNEPAIESMPETLDPDHAAYWIPCHPWMNKREDASAYARDFRARELCPMV